MVFRLRVPARAAPGQPRGIGTIVDEVQSGWANGYCMLRARGIDLDMLVLERA